MAELPEPAPRQHLHTRQVTTRGYLRDDGLWDLECELVDTKTYSYRNGGGQERKAGDPVHHMKIRLTVDGAMTVRDVAASMPATPFAECQPAADPMRGMVGVKIGPGWRKAVDEAMGDVRGCTHLRELLGAMATVAFQTIPNHQLHLRRVNGEPLFIDGKPGFQMGKCLGWDFNGPAVARVAPQFIGWNLRLAAAEPSAKKPSAGKP